MTPLGFLLARTFRQERPLAALSVPRADLFAELQGKSVALVGNARALVDVGSAVLLDDADCTTEGLAAVLGPLVDEPARLEAMARDAWTIGRPHAAADAADLLLAQMAGAR